VRPLTIFFWHVHGSWTTAFVQGPHRYLVATLPDRGMDGLGRARTWCWPASVVEVTPAEAAAAPVDVVVLQRPLDLDLAPTWLGGRRPGRDVAAVYVEHNAPQGRINEMRHLLADRTDVPIVHVTHFNDLFWDSGRAPHRVVEHGVIDPGHRFSGELPHAVAAINEPGRRGRVTGTDLLAQMREVVPVDLFGMGSGSFGGQDVPQSALHAEMARRRAYLHPFRWTSLGLTLIEAMMLGLPVVALATTEASEAVPPTAGVISNRVDVLQQALRAFVHDVHAASAAGRAGRAAALDRFSVERFVADWDGVLDDAVATARARP
jgi:glycosyltransferase involved in cell wall biosynthesis